MGILLLAVSPWVFYGALNGADLATHWQANARGCREVNPMMRGPAVVDVLAKGALTVAMVKLDRRARGKRRLVVRITWGSLTAAGVASNSVCNR
ncbi:MAG TPA: hypothetical protein VGJ25_16255 [Gaiellaceae bacterium]|jgi:hypothetical protein